MTPSPTSPAGPAGTGTDTGTDVAALAARVEAAVLAVPGVVGLHAGAFGEVGTFLPGRKVAGVRLDTPDGRPQVHVVATTAAPVTATAAAVHTALATVLPGPVDVVVGEVLTPAEQVEQAPAQLEAASTT